MLPAKKLCHTSYDLVFLYGDICCMAHVSCNEHRVVWAHLKCVEMGKFDCGMSIYTSNIIHSYRTGEIMVTVFFLRNRRW